MLRELCYPFDSAEIMHKRRKLLRVIGRLAFRRHDAFGKFIHETRAPLGQGLAIEHASDCRRFRYEETRAASSAHRLAKLVCRHQHPARMTAMTRDSTHLPQVVSSASNLPAVRELHPVDSSDALVEYLDDMLDSAVGTNQFIADFQVSIPYKPPW